MRERNGSPAARLGGRLGRRLVLAAGLLLAGCNGTVTSPSAFSQLPRGQPVEPAPGEKFLLRYLRDPAETERLYVEFDRRSSSLTRDDQAVRQRLAENEEFTGVVFSYTTGQTPTGHDRLYLICNELTYRFTGPGERRTAVSQRQPLVSPNFAREYQGAPLFYYAVDALGQLAVLDAPGMAAAERHPWHYLFRDSLGYLFPTLPEAELAVGETWSALIPVVVGLHYDRNDFLVALRGRLEGIEELPEPGGAPGATCRVARLAYKWTGEFDTRQYPDRFSVEETNRYREHFRVSGSGELLLDLRRGRLLAQQDRMTITTEVRSLQDLPPAKRGGERRIFWLANEGTHEFDFFARRLAPGEKLPGHADVSPPVRPRPPAYQPPAATPRSRAWITEPSATEGPPPTGPPEPLLPEESPPPPPETPPPTGR